MGQGAESCRGYELEYDPYSDNEDGMWLQKNGGFIHVSKMPVSQLRNCKRICEKMALTSSSYDEEGKWNNWVRVFEDELANRNEPLIATPAKYVNPDAKKATRGSKAKMLCHCGKPYEARESDLKRGYGFSCCKRCASVRREFGRPKAIKINDEQFKYLMEQQK